MTRAPASWLLPVFSTSPLWSMVFSLSGSPACSLCHLHGYMDMCSLSLPLLLSLPSLKACDCIGLTFNSLACIPPLYSPFSPASQTTRKHQGLVTFKLSPTPVPKPTPSKVSRLRNAKEWVFLALN